MCVMPKIECTAEEADLLCDVLANYLADLKTEIADTDAHEFRESLRRKEAAIASLLARFAGK